jgi:hypothetical protein
MTRVLLALVLSFAGVVRADQFVSFDLEDERSAMIAAFNRAAGLNPLSAADGDQARVWYMGFPGVHPTATGYIVTKDGVYLCRVKTDLTHGGMWVRSGHCGTRRHYPERLAAALARIGEGPGFDGKGFGCDVMDGWEAHVEGMVGGKQFRFGASNTNECAASKGGEIAQVDSWLDAMSGAYYKSDDARR